MVLYDACVMRCFGHLRAGDHVFVCVGERERVVYQRWCQDVARVWLDVVGVAWDPCGGADRVGACCVCLQCAVVAVGDVRE